ncbi:MAG: hypothetical protein COW24_00675 [Candidatus Kerfeldbacteria bacterium CG15_BIG_FIL_POST_REV_8_21_14_020_45_12]|uniref:DoxX family protein n=1 Tax=Candidatus Kerfeldbacteria bacterium CG15_BIG_FIL_POST_REV_8_21_14_020_45_12 TaxID=2014247 RepID=A0A2M7H519_9BACT|nr:MAG: hypothetical protein COW24_00675 [Candidatus Kerfeldbacteria bacterium CG15_BIG_FIL_POST_REV_8_21_14_020_45_12]PJA93132.1 MAG: hypothetical protein CO132_04495 [Candidatus Kerfeldbacteria bacterium CG_4_9_14_3_um_filter_45_8]
MTNTVKYKLFGFLTLLLALEPLTASAHVKWFVDSDDILAHETVYLSLANPAILIWVVIVIGLASISILLDRKITALPSLLQQKMESWKPMINRLFYLLIATWLIINSYQGFLLSPNFQVTSLPENLLLFVQFITGLTVFLRKLHPLAGGLLLITYLGSAILNPGVEVFENIFVIGIALYLAFHDNVKIKKLPQANVWAIPILRVTTGASLIILAFTEKLLHPALAYAFLAKHNLNFMPMLGMNWFNDQLFVISAGMTEVVFGIILIMGTITRINTLALSFFFVSTTIILGPSEVMGHLPFFGTALLLIFFGSGEKLKIKIQRPNQLGNST